MRQHTTQRTDVQHLVVTGVRRRSRCARRRARRAAAPRSRSTRAPPPERRVERVERETRRQGAAEDDRRVEHVAPRCATTECDRTRNALNARDARARRASVVTCDRALLKAVTHGRSVGARRAACARTRSGSERACEGRVRSKRRARCAPRSRASHRGRPSTSENSRVPSGVGRWIAISMTCGTRSANRGWNAL